MCLGVEICCLPEWSVIDTRLDKRKALSGWNADWPLIVCSRCITLCYRWTQECSCARERCRLSVRYVIVDTDMWTHLVKGSAVWPSLERVCVSCLFAETLHLLCLLLRTPCSSPGASRLLLQQFTLLLTFWWGVTGNALIWFTLIVGGEFCLPLWLTDWLIVTKELVLSDTSSAAIPPSICTHDAVHTHQAIISLFNKMFAVNDFPVFSSVSGSNSKRGTSALSPYTLVWECYWSALKAGKWLPLSLSVLSAEAANGQECNRGVCLSCRASEVDLFSSQVQAGDQLLSKPFGNYSALLCGRETMKHGVVAITVW